MSKIISNISTEANKDVCTILVEQLKLSIETPNLVDIDNYMITYFEELRGIDLFFKYYVTCVSRCSCFIYDMYLKKL